MAKDDTSGKGVRLFSTAPRKIATGDREIDAALVKIADLARIDEAKREAFYRTMRVALKEARRPHLKRDELNSAFPKLSAVVEHLDKIGETAKALAGLLVPGDTVRSHALDHLYAALVGHGRDDGLLEKPGRDDDSLEIMPELLARMEAAAANARRFVEKPVEGIGYQVTNIRNNLGAKLVILSLIGISDTMGERLTFSRGPDDVEGPLIEAINILKGMDKLFPHGFFPIKLRKVCEDARKEFLNTKPIVSPQIQSLKPT